MKNRYEDLQNKIKSICYSLISDGDEGRLLALYDLGKISQILEEYIKEEMNKEKACSVEAI